MNTLFVKPAPGLLVRDPETKERLPAEGRAVPHTAYWERRLQDGDVVAAEDTNAPELEELFEGRGQGDGQGDNP